MTINDWLIKETDGNITYYGFATPSAKEDELKWSILRQEEDGNTITRKWANNNFGTDKYWDDRVEYFQNPSGETITLINSGITGDNSYFSKKFNASWDYVKGVSLYTALVYEKDINNHFKVIKKDQRMELTPQRRLLLSFNVLDEKDYKIEIIGQNGEGQFTYTLEFSTKE